MGWFGWQTSGQPIFSQKLKVRNFLLFFITNKKHFYFNAANKIYLFVDFRI